MILHGALGDSYLQVQIGALRCKHLRNRQGLYQVKESIMATNDQGNKQGSKKRGFAAMNPDQQREIASEGGRAAHEKGTAHEFTSEEARRAGSMSHKNDRSSQSASGGSRSGADDEDSDSGSGGKASSRSGRSKS
jgi:hypothetical protein